ncbi:MAG: hypothetical protein M3P40_10105 [Actinomycetota bacterium]|nr:hypothetical protein [Actinomycetota bacterium]
MSRLSALAAFAAVANNTSADVLGVFALISAVAAAGVALGPAIVAKPLAATEGQAERRRRAHHAVSASAAVAAAAAIAFAACSVPADGLVGLTLLGAAFAAWGALTVEAVYWAIVFTSGARRAGWIAAAVYAVQAGGTLALAGLGLGRYLALAPSALLAAAGTIALLCLHPSPAAARAWLTDYRPQWLPYVGGVAASIAMVQAIPLLLTAIVGLTAASVFRALELTFGPTNLAASVTTNAALARSGRDGFRALYRKAGILLALIAMGNGLALVLAPRALLELVLGTAADPLIEVAATAIFYRTAYAVSLVGAIVLVPVYHARTIGLVTAGAVVVTLSAMLLGLVAGGLPGGFAGLGVSEATLAAMYWVLLRRRMAS